MFLIITLNESLINRLSRAEMDLNIKKSVILVILLVLLYYESMILLVDVFRIEIDHVSTVNHIQDGDTFTLESGYWVRLADIDTPEEGETGYSEAGDYLGNLIYGKKVYLDIDDVYTYDYEGTGKRLVCLTYISYNTSHYINVNKDLLESGHAVITEYDNEFTPSNWTLYTSKLYSFSFYELRVFSGIIAILFTIILYVLYKKLGTLINNISNSIKNKFKKY